MSPASSVSLCLACSASLPPGKANANTFYTSCCSRPICPNCISANPRLARYNPCLRCLAGVKAVNSRSLPGTHNLGSGAEASPRANIDGSIRDEDLFVVEDEDDSDVDADGDSVEDDDSDSHVNAPTQDTGHSTLQPPLPNEPPDLKTTTDIATKPSHPSSLKSAEHPTRASESEVDNVQGVQGIPPKYFIRPDDTLLGISFKLGIDGRVLCRLNGLPISTLRTTPHLLHTRAFLNLPLSARPPPPLSPTERALDEERKARLAVERAETRFQALTKETDRDVAKAYVALASLHAGADGTELAADSKEYEKGEKEDGLRKRRALGGVSGEGSAVPGEGSLEGRATEQYFDDEEWEGREQVEGRGVTIPSFPYLSGSDRAAGKLPAGERKPWWRWRN